MNTPDSDTLLVASQLSRRGLLDDSDIKGSILDPEQEEAANTVMTHLRREAEHESRYTEEELDYLIAQEEIIEKTLDGDIDLDELIRDLMKKQAVIDPASAAKLYLELADIAYSENNADEASDYVRKGLDTSSVSSDREFADTADNIVDIVFRSNDPEQRKDLADYVEALDEQRMPVGIPDLDIVAPEEPVDYDTDDDRDDDDDDNGRGFPGGNGGHDDNGYDDGNDGNDGNGGNDGYDDNGNGGNDGNGGDEGGNGGVPTSDRSFVDNVTDEINQQAGAVNIISIDARSFPTVKAVVAADESLVTDAESFKQHMHFTDAGVEIEDYTVEKVNYTGINVILVCDDSGSMEGSPRDDLSNAVKAFVNNADANVDIGIVPFASEVKSEMVAPLGSDKSTLLASADGLCADGGTNIYDAVVYAETLFPIDPNELNIMILMSDGQDNAPDPERLTALKQACVQANISIFSVGLGPDVDANLLQQYSSACNGDYFYVSSSESILSFYDFIFNIGKNRYNVTFEAVDQFLVDRTLEVRYDDSATTYDSQTYSLFRNDVADELEDGISATVGGVTINGLREKMIYPSANEQILTLTGDGFESNATIALELHGVSNYTCTVEYTDSTSAKVTVPGNIPAGLYDVYVTYNGRRAVFASGLIVCGGDSNIITFGEYVFTASNVSTSGSSTTMSGVVMLNDWLGFKDPVTLTGNLEANDIQMDFGRTYMIYTEDTATGFAKYLAQHGYTMSLPVVNT